MKVSFYCGCTTDGWHELHFDDIAVTADSVGALIHWGWVLGWALWQRALISVIFWYILEFPLDMVLVEMRYGKRWYLDKSFKLSCSWVGYVVKVAVGVFYYGNTEDWNHWQLHGFFDYDRSIRPHYPLCGTVHRHLLYPRGSSFI